ncbi:hypothetical protein Ddc_10025 [Ditylenchus destructor]|nr:hypothetical protein Ddc_10025 [Ditylenchus destructor]
MQNPANVILYNDGIKVGEEEPVRYTDRDIHPLLSDIALGILYPHIANVILYNDGIKVGEEEPVRYTDRDIHPLLRDIALGSIKIIKGAQELDPVEMAQQEVNLDGSQPVTSYLNKTTLSR